MTASDALLHLRYSTWASRKLVEAAKLLKPEDLTRSVGVSHEGILGTLGHIQMADWVWYTRVVEPFDRPEPTLEAIETIWPEIHRRWEAWAAKLTDNDLARVVSYKALDGNSHESPVWQIVLHLVNHGTLHRGQVVGLIRQLGVKPPATDLIYYYRELKS